MERAAYYDPSKNVYPFFVGASIAERMATSGVLGSNGSWPATQERVYGYMSDGDPVRDWYG